MDLQTYSWPGNVRELENAIERAMILSGSKKLNFAHLLELDENSAATNYGLLASPKPETMLSADELVAFERNNMIKALRQCKWKIYGDDGAAGLLGIKPTTLIERMKRKKIKKPRKRESRKPGG